MKANRQIVDRKQFRSSVDTILAIIEFSLERKQTVDAEKYIDYLFDAAFMYYVKGFYHQEHREGDEKGLSESKMDSYRLLFLEGKIFNLLLKSIRPAAYQQFHYLFHDKYLELLAALLVKDEEAAISLLNINGDLSMSLLPLSEEISNQERVWFKKTLNSVFERLYVEPISERMVGILIKMLKDTLSRYVDFNEIDLFQDDMLAFSERFPLSEIGEYNEDDILEEFQLNPERSLLLYQFKAPYTKVILDKQLGEAKANSILIGVPGLYEAVEKMMVGRFKHLQIKLSLFTSIVYSFYKGNYNFIEPYLDLHQPPDSDALWAGRNFAFRPSEIYDLLPLKDEILDYFKFGFRHHGFSVYFYQVIAYFLLTYGENHIPLGQKEQANEAFHLKEIKKYIKPSDRFWINTDKNPKELPAIIDFHLQYL